MSQKTQWVRAYAVFRVDDGAVASSEPLDEMGPPNLTIKEIVMSEDEARSEVRRLNRENPDKGATYFWQGTHLFQHGGSHGSDTDRGEIGDAT